MRKLLIIIMALIPAGLTSASDAYPSGAVAPSASGPQETVNPAAIGGVAVNVMAHGAKCDGTSNDTASFAAAVAAAVASGSPIFVPAKTCVAHVVMVKGAQLYGYGATIKSPDGNSPTILADVSSTVFGVSLVGYGSGSSDIGISQPSHSAGRVVIRDVFAQHYGEEALNVQGLANKIDNLLAYNTALNHVSDTSGKHCAVLINGTDNVIENSEVGTSVQSYGFNPHLVRGAICVTAANNFIGPNNQFETSDFGVYDSGYWNKFTNNRADLNGGPGFIASGVGSYYLGNHSHNNGQAATNTYDDFVATGSNNNNFVANMASNSNHKCLTGGGICYTRYAYNNDSGYQANFSQNKTQWPAGTKTILWNPGTGSGSSFSTGASNAEPRQ